MNKKLLLPLFILIPIAIVVLLIYYVEINKEDKVIGEINLNNPKGVDIIDKEENYKDNTRIKVIINDKEFVIVLEDNETSNDFLNLLPLDVEMNELNGNEKYYYMENNIKSNPKDVARIQTGDIMLFGSNCVVLFYKGFNTTYQYTSIGHIENVNGLTSALGSGSVRVRFETIE